MKHHTASMLEFWECFGRTIREAVLLVPPSVGDEIIKDLDATQPPQVEARRKLLTGFLVVADHCVRVLHEVNTLEARKLISEFLAMRETMNLELMATYGPLDPVLEMRRRGPGEE